MKQGKRHTFANVYSACRPYIVVLWLISAMAAGNEARAQLDTIHWIPPMHTRVATQVEDHYIYLSTPEITPFDVEIRNGAGVLLSTESLSNATPRRYTISNNSPSVVMVPLSDLNNVLPDKGLILSASRPFYANFRARSTAQAGSLTAKGRSGAGTTFRVGVMPIISEDQLRNFFTGIMATEDNTIVTISQYDANIVFAGNVPVTNDSLTFLLNAGESYVISGYTNIAANRTGFVGALVQSDKPIVMNCGNLLGSIAPGGGQDMAIDQNVPVDRIDREYILIEGLGLPSMERPMIVAHYDSTIVSVGGVQVDILDAGQYHLIDNNHYSADGNMYVATSRPAYMYQFMGGAANEANPGMSIIPSVSCFIPYYVDLVPDIDLIGATTFNGGIYTMTGSNDTLYINGIAQGAGDPVIGQPEWQTYKILGLTGNTVVTSTGPTAVGFFGGNGFAGFAGFYSGFSTKPIARIKSGTEIPDIVLEVQNQYEHYQWLNDGDTIPGATSYLFSPEVPGFYDVSVANSNCQQVSDTVFTPAPTTTGGGAKKIDTITLVAANIIDVRYRVTLENFGPSDMFNLQVLDSLSVPLCAIVNVIDPPSLSGGALYGGGPNPAFAPGVDNRLLLGTDVLPNGTADTIFYTLRFDMSEIGCQGPITNFATLSSAHNGPNDGTGPLIYINNIAVEGDDPDPNNDNNPDEEGDILYCFPPLDQTTVNYPENAVYRLQDSLQTPDISGWVDGIFTSMPGGIVLDPVSGQIDPQSSTVGTYSITYTYGADPCINEVINNVTIIADYDDDGVIDDIDPDDDNDGIPDTVEGDGDADGDGLINRFDLDSDNDGITDVTEAGGYDPNQDGIVGDLPPVDSDGDGLLDPVDPSQGNAVLVANDSDGDGIPDIHDLDSDNDGLTDISEAGGSDPDHDGIIGTGAFTDENNNGWSDLADLSEGGTPLSNTDTDGDGKPNAYDIDSDNDGFTDIWEAGGLDVDNDGRIDNFIDTDQDGHGDITDPDSGNDPWPDPDYDNDNVADRFDVDSDNDGVTDLIENRITGIGINGQIDTFEDQDNDGYAARFDPDEGGTIPVSIDTDGDGIHDIHDLDSDNDGLTDLSEAGGEDIDNTGIIAGFTDTDQDGYADQFDADTGGVPLPYSDSDNDGVDNRIDIDSDNDGLTDIREAGGSDVDGDGRIDNFLDADQDGHADITDPDSGNSPWPDDDYDGDGIVDRLDLDSDNDGIADLAESNGVDSDADGQVDTFEDADNDGLAALFDPDEGGTATGNYDTDSDGIPDRHDLDSDNDGVTDLAEAGGEDVDNTGIVVGFTDTDRNGYADEFETQNGGVPLLYSDIDNDGVSDRIDIDSDNDGLTDLLEVGGPDVDGDGRIDNFLDTDHDGHADITDPDQGGSAWDIPDTDTDGLPDFLDSDSDNDGLTDLREAGGSDIDGNGRIDNFLDTDQDGQGDITDPDSGNSPLPDADHDGDGIVDRLDLDSDNDGITDLAENKGTDSDADGQIDTFQDQDNDGYAAVFDPDEGGTALGNPDTDGDGVPDSYDLDSDNDGITDLAEAGGNDVNNTGIVVGFTDTDQDGYADAFDADNSGIPLLHFDTDTDGVPDRIDADSDNDGLSDILEAGGHDEDGDGRIDGFTDVDGDGHADITDPDQGGAAWDMPDTDLDAVPNLLDGDTDNDGIFDWTEARANSMPPLYKDTDNDGTDDAFDIDQGGTFTNVPFDTDADNTPDFQDEDTDEDGILDYVEGTSPPLFPVGIDSDGDGIDDAFDPDSGGQPNNSPVDTDADGLPDFRDTDSDNDGNPDQNEAGGEIPGFTDTDHDGIVDFRDLYNGVIIPQLLTPNEDGFNDRLVVSGLQDFPDNKLMIFNRWGNLVFESEPYHNDWDGSGINSKPLPEGTYYYLMDMKNGNKPVRGYIYLTR